MNAPHGTRARYIAGCHKECCRKPHREYMRDYLPRWRLRHPRSPAPAPPNAGGLRCASCGTPVAEHPLTRKCA